jgi:hypothetical protein
MGHSSLGCLGRTLVLANECAQVTAGVVTYSIQPAAKLLPRNRLGYSREKLVAEQAFSLQRLVAHAGTDEKTSIRYRTSSLRSNGAGCLPADRFTIDIGPEHIQGMLDEVKRCFGLTSRTVSGTVVEAESHSLKIFKNGVHQSAYRMGNTVPVTVVRTEYSGSWCCAFPPSS